MAANEITDTDRIRGGDVLTIPEDTTVVDASADAGEPTREAGLDPTASVAELADAFELRSLSHGVGQALLEAVVWCVSDWDPPRVGVDTRVRLAARYLRDVQDRTHSEDEALMAFRQGLDSFLNDNPTTDAEVSARAVVDIRDQRS